MPLRRFAASRALVSSGPLDLKELVLRALHLCPKICFYCSNHYFWRYARDVRDAQAWSAKGTLKKPAPEPSTIGVTLVTLVTFVTLGRATCNSNRYSWRYAIISCSQKNLLSIKSSGAQQHNLCVKHQTKSQNKIWETLQVFKIWIAGMKAR